MFANTHIQRILSAIGLLSNARPRIDSPPSSHGDSPSLVLFGGSVPWNTSTLTWAAVDDRLRGGSSISHLNPVDGGDNAAVFSGHLDTHTLGGAGFASQTTKPASESGTHDALLWDLSTYDGIELLLGSCDTKTYTLTIKDTMPDSKRPDGRERSSISWEADFKPTEAQGAVWLPWSDFRATYRGRDKMDAPPLRLEQLRRFSLMMRSFFKEQEGDFRLEVKRIAAIKKAAAV